MKKYFILVLILAFSSAVVFPQKKSSKKSKSKVESPKKDKDAIKFESITFQDVIKKGLKVMDMTAFTLSEENKLPIIVFDMNTNGNLIKLVSGSKIGTIVDNQ